MRAVAASKIPVITGIGHEVDESLADLVADKRASTPSNAAELLTKDKIEERERVYLLMNKTKQILCQNIQQAEDINAGKILKISDGLIMKYINPMIEMNYQKISKCFEIMNDKVLALENNLKQKEKILSALNPLDILKRGYAILTGKLAIGETINIMTFKQEIEASINNIKERSVNE